MTRYDRITVDFYVEFEGPSSFVVEPNDAQKADPRFLAFLDWAREVRASAVATGGALDVFV